MVETELKELLDKIRNRKCEEQVVEVKAAHKGCPEKLYDTFCPRFSNQDSGGTLVFGLDEKQNFAKVGVYDPQDLQKKVMEYGEQMTPVVRPVFTVYAEEEKGVRFCRDSPGRCDREALLQKPQKVGYKVPIFAWETRINR